MRVHKNFFYDRLSTQLAIACGQSGGDDGVMRAVLGIHLAGEAHAPAAAHARSASVVWHRIAQHGYVKRMKSEALRSRLENLVFAIPRKRRHRQWTSPWRPKNVIRVVA